MKIKKIYWIYFILFVGVQVAIWLGYRSYQYQNSMSCRYTVNRVAKSGAVEMEAETIAIFNGARAGSVKMNGVITVGGEKYNFSHLMFFNYTPVGKGAFYHVKMDMDKDNSFYSDPPLPEGIQESMIGLIIDKNIFGIRYINDDTLIIGDGSFPLVICNRSE